VLECLEPHQDPALLLEDLEHAPTTHDKQSEAHNTGNDHSQLDTAEIVQPPAG
jgi:hypothetical protein